MTNMELVTITPAYAEALLNNNYEGNRQVRKTRVNELARMMRSGEFVSTNGQTIVLGTDGKVYDGQHRLAAIVESGVTLDFFVFTTDEPKKAFLTFDNHSRRSAADYLTGMPSKNDVAALAKVMCSLDEHGSTLRSALHGNTNKGHRVSRADVVTYAFAHADELAECVRRGQQLRNELKTGPKSGYTMFVAVVRYCERDHLLDEFMRDYKSLTPCASVAAAKKAIVNQAAAKRQRGTMSTEWLLGILLCSYEHFIAKDGVETLSRHPTYIDRYDKLVDEARWGVI